MEAKIKKGFPESSKVRSSQGRWLIDNPSEYKITDFAGSYKSYGTAGDMKGIVTHRMQTLQKGTAERCVPRHRADRQLRGEMFIHLAHSSER